MPRTPPTWTTQAMRCTTQQPGELARSCLISCLRMLQTHKHAAARCGFLEAQPGSEESEEPRAWPLPRLGPGSGRRYRLQPC